LADAGVVFLPVRKTPDARRRAVSSVVTCARRLIVMWKGRGVAVGVGEGLSGKRVPRGKPVEGN